jgi:hypothetical protein
LAERKAQKTLSRNSKGKKMHHKTPYKEKKGNGNNSDFHNELALRAVQAGNRFPDLVVAAGNFHTAKVLVDVL